MGTQGREAWAATFQPVLQQLRERILARPPEQVADAAGVGWRGEAKELRLTCLGEAFRIPWPALQVYPAGADRPCSADLQGLLLYYLALADGAPPALRWIGFRELPDGWLYHQAFQGYTGEPLVQAVGNDVDAFARAACKLGGRSFAFGDAAFAFQALPRVHLAIVYWQGDDEFPPRAQVLFDAAASHYLPTDGLAVLGHLLVHRLLTELSPTRRDDTPSLPDKTGQEAMTTTIALAGKGGTGKTTVAALLIKHLIECGSGSILAIDADPSSNLNLALGLPLEQTIGDIREDMLKQVNTSNGSLANRPGMSKADYLDYEIEYALVEGEYVDLLAMGRPEGPGCYCAVNHILRDIIDRLGRSYEYVVIDNEAGLEHLSRRTTRDVDVLLIVTDPTMRGIIAASRIAEISRELDVNVKQAYLVLNRVSGDLSPSVQEAIDSLGVPLVGVIPEDPEIMALDAEGRPLVDIGQGSRVYRAVQGIAEKTVVGARALVK